MIENNRKKNSIYRMILFNKVIYFFGGRVGSRNLFIKMKLVDFEWRVWGVYIFMVWIFCINICYFYK